MAIELSNLTFTDQADVVPVSGVEEISNTGMANTLAGNDRITSTGKILPQSTATTLCFLTLADFITTAR